MSGFPVIIAGEEFSGGGGSRGCSLVPVEVVLSDCVAGLLCWRNGTGQGGSQGVVR